LIKLLSSLPRHWSRFRSGSPLFYTVVFLSPSYEKYNRRKTFSTVRNYVTLWYTCGPSPLKENTLLARHDHDDDEYKFGCRPRVPGIGFEPSSMTSLRCMFSSWGFVYSLHFANAVSVDRCCIDSLSFLLAWMFFLTRDLLPFRVRSSRITALM